MGNEQCGEYDVCYVCISDMHLGEEDSLLTNVEGGNLDTRNPSEVMVKLVECLKEIIDKNQGSKKPTLILNGDILEMALTRTNIAAMTFDRFQELIINEADPLFDRIIYVPGNHDHHLWELAREKQYSKYILRHVNEELPFPWHKTPMLIENPPHLNGENAEINPIQSGGNKTGEDKRTCCELLDSLIMRHFGPDYAGIKLKEDIQVEIVYPNLGLFSEDGKKCVLIHHGHFVEAIYRLMSGLKASALGIDRDMPADVQTLESENFAWIDFFWSTMGRSGDAGKISETFYEHLGNKEQMGKLTAEIARNLSKKHKIIPLCPNRLESVLVRSFLNRYFCGGFASDWEKCLKEGAVGENTIKGMLLYLRTAWNQIIEEKNGATPSELTFIFGHTHKPFDLCIPLKGVLIDGLNTDINIYNTGGWVVDEVECNKNKGASIALLDKALNHTALYMYNETKSPESSRVKVAGRTAKDNPFHRRIESIVNKDEKLWNEFSNVVDYEIELRKEDINCRLQGL